MVNVLLPSCGHKTQVVNRSTVGPHKAHLLHPQTTEPPNYSVITTHQIISREQNLITWLLVCVPECSSQSSSLHEHISTERFKQQWIKIRVSALATFNTAPQFSLPASSCFSHTPARCSARLWKDLHAPTNTHFTWVEEVSQRPILAIHPREGRAPTVSQPDARRPMSLGGSLRPGQAGRRRGAAVTA